jgi:hypothetical protein
MEFNDLLKVKQIDPATVLVFRHSPKEESLFKVMPWFITEKPQTFNAYQQTQTPRVEKQMERAKFVAVFSPCTSVSSTVRWVPAAPRPPPP